MTCRRDIAVIYAIADVIDAAIYATLILMSAAYLLLRLPPPFCHAAAAFTQMSMITPLIRFATIFIADISLRHR